jgi:hypothetical protein
MLITVGKIFSSLIGSNFGEFLNDFLLTALLPQIDSRVEEYLKVYIHGRLVHVFTIQELMPSKINHFQCFLVIHL